MLKVLTVHTVVEYIMSVKVYDVGGISNKLSLQFHDINII